MRNLLLRWSRITMIILIKSQIINSKTTTTNKIQILITRKITLNSNNTINRQILQIKLIIKMSKLMSIRITTTMITVNNSNRTPIITITMRINISSRLTTIIRMIKTNTMLSSKIKNTLILTITTTNSMTTLISTKSSSTSPTNSSINNQLINIKTDSIKQKQSNQNRKV